MKQLFKTCWALYGILLMAVALLVYFPICWLGLLLGGKGAERPLLHFGYKYIAGSVSAALLIRYKVFGKEKFDRKGAYVLVSNHRSLLDIFAVEISSPVTFKFLSKKENERIPVFGYIIKKLCIPIQRKNKASRATSVQAMKTALEEEMSVLVFPEGTRNRTKSALLEFYDGAFRLAIESDRPIMVQTLIGSEKITKPNEKWQLAPGRILAYWDGPFSTKNLSIADIDVLKSQVRAAMLKRINEQ